LRMGPEMATCVLPHWMSHSPTTYRLASPCPSVLAIAQHAQPRPTGYITASRRSNQSEEEAGSDALQIDDADALEAGTAERANHQWQICAPRAPRQSFHQAIPVLPQPISPRSAPNG
jgi:hypothetical protein